VKRIVLILLVLVSTKAFSQLRVGRADLDSLRSYMVGSFSATEQTADGSTRNIHLNINTVWTHRIDGVWLYAEQALDSSLDKPYSQVVYHLFPINDTTVVSQAYDIIEPASVIGAWHNPGLFDPLLIGALKLRVGCGVMLHKYAGVGYTGSTQARQCSTDKSGAAYITTDVKISRNKLQLWERGWDAYDKQVWGGVQEGYVFVKQ
jgi:CpeT protein